MHTYYSENGHFVSDGTIDTLRHNLRFLGEGVSRTVYELSDKEVLKVNRNKRSFAGTNENEVNVWNNLDEEDKIHFAAVIAHSPSFSWIVAERIPNVGSVDTEELEEIADKYGISDLHDQNVGCRDDLTPVILDYAFDYGRNGRNRTECSHCQETHTDSATAVHGSECTYCEDRHETDTAERHGRKCQACRCFTMKPITYRLFKTDIVHEWFPKDKGLIVQRRVNLGSKWTLRTICPTCAGGADNGEHSGIREVSPLSDNRNIPGQQQLLV